MPSPLLADLAARVQGALRPLAGAVSYRETVTFEPQLGQDLPDGGTSLTLTSLPAGMDRVMQGDRILSFYGGVTIAAEVVAIGGTIAAAPLSAPAPFPMWAGATLTIQRDIDRSGQGWEEEASQSIAVGVSIVTGERVWCVLANSLDVVPQVDGFMVGPDGSPRIIKNVSKDPMGAVWRLTVGGA